MSPPARRPARVLVLAIAQEECLRIGITLEDILGDGKRKNARITKARNRAILRIVAESGCSIAGVSAAWGSCRTGIARGYRSLATVYDPVTLNRLTWQYGPDRALRIAKGNDSQTQADLAAWRRLGTRTAA